VTQVASAAEGHIFHNRLTHSLKVGQIARRLAEKLRREGRTDAARQIEPEVAEAAGLAHDLGHPPFGHVGEAELDRLLKKNGCLEGYEGNPQSFRILTRLAVRADGHDGLDLTRATLAAIMKYPWLREPDHTDRQKKWAAYAEDRPMFEFARAGLTPGIKTLEAAIMDWADDIAYSVHDLEDFYRAGLVSWLHLRQDDARERVVEKALQGWHKQPESAKKDLEQASIRLEVMREAVVSLLSPFNGDRQQRSELRWFTSELIGRFLQAAKIGRSGTLEIEPEYEHEVRFLKGITRCFVIDNTALAAQQHGQRRVLEELFTDLYDAANVPSKRALFPHRTRHLLTTKTENPPRVVADTIACMTEEEVVALHRRLRGIDGGTVLNPIVR